MRRIWLAGAAVAALVALGCGSNTPTSPGLSLQALQGEWTSTSNNNGPDSCTNFSWTVSSVSNNSAAGSFSARCNNIDITGTATATLPGNTLAWTTNGTITPAGAPSCLFAVAGTATLENNNTQVRITYSGTICGVSVNGVEVLKKK
jgi:hypothetical protein